MGGSRGSNRSAATACPALRARDSVSRPSSPWPTIASDLLLARSRGWSGRRPCEPASRRRCASRSLSPLDRASARVRPHPTRRPLIVRDERLTHELGDARSHARKQERAAGGRDDRQRVRVAWKAIANLSLSAFHGCGARREPTSRQGTSASGLRGALAETTASRKRDRAPSLRWAQPGADRGREQREVRLAYA